MDARGTIQETLFGAYRKNFRPNLHQACEKYGICTDLFRLADKAHVGTERDLQVRKMKQACITKVNVHVPGSRLNQKVRANRKRGGFFSVVQHRALHRNIIRDVVGTSDRLDGGRALGHGRGGKQRAAKHIENAISNCNGFHVLTPMHKPPCQDRGFIRTLI